MYVVYRCMENDYAYVASFDTLAEASACADGMRRQHTVGARKWYYVAGPGTPLPAGVQLPRSAQARSTHRATPAHPTPARGIRGWFARLIRWMTPAPPAELPITSAQRPSSAST